MRDRLHHLENGYIFSKLLSIKIPNILLIDLCVI